MTSDFRRIFYVLLAQVLVFSSFVSSEKAPRYTFLKDATSAPRVSRFDYIVIGGGTAGCPLAATLSQNATVLLLERGGSPYDPPGMTDMKNFAATLSDRSPTSPSQQFVSEDGVYNARARVLGGGSVLNAGFYTRASPGYVREAGWDEARVKSSYEWVERKVAFEPPMLAWQSAVRDGLVEAGVAPYNGFTYDHMYGTKVGGTIFDREGHRHTAADLLEYANPTGLVVHLHATVHKILLTKKVGPRKPKAYGVIFQDKQGGFHTAKLTVGAAAGEVILSAGALGSPQLLMLSGVGPRDQLAELGVEVVAEQPLVGGGMADNPMNALFVPSPVPVEISLIQVVGITKADSYVEAASGMAILYGGVQELQDKLRSLLSNKTAKPISAVSEQTEAPPNTWNITVSGGVILEKIMGPVSTGNLRLLTTDPNANPSVRFNYFQEPEDLNRCVRGMKTIVDVINSKPFSRFRNSDMSVQDFFDLMMAVPMNLRPKHVTAAFSLEQFCIDTVMTIWHYHGGCRLGEVVDKEYKVFGVDGLRVIDGSTFFKSPGTNPQATVMMLGRYMGLKILEEKFRRGT